ncbi:hypothetical protein FNF29_08162 [Cafeteria roenbergensis]|uniref:FAD-binding PCMH-type domain-containing protein n=1 Tax=Cafeteria roenbergensis TaxID=33653 RepID=A0A5A8C372_CAFRO|nr:hypothetical protein FNF29_08162 [Cafeteria roenbergensis]|eukprot:KAA0146291.1 hypothetical protein FNF29_08162 [Cafeteria roenbergensis]
MRIAMLALAVAGALGEGSLAARTYCMPGQPCWPSEQQLAAFAAALDGDAIGPSSPLYPNASLINNRRFVERPGLIVQALSEADVATSLALASKHDIRVSIISTGHDYDGRNSGNGTLQINLRKMQLLSVSFEPPVPVLSAGPGCTWGQVFEFVHDHAPGWVALGGSDPSVGVSGWTMGGGHSPLSSYAGLGVDSVLAFRLVLANGSLVTASQDSNSDLFWALRGGGGGTFGVAVQLSFRLHPEPGRLNVLSQYFFLFSPSTLDVGQALANWLAAAPGNVSGYIFVSNLGTPATQYFGWNLIYRGTSAQAEAAAAPLLALPSVYSANASYDSFYDYQKGVPADLGGVSAYLFSSFLSNSTLQAGALGVAIDYARARFNSTLAPVRSCTGTVLGGAVEWAGAQSGATAVHPGFRNARVALTCAAAWEQPGDVQFAEQIADGYATLLGTMGEGHYLNEPESHLNDWQQGFWGPPATYSRLASIKLRVDPTMRFLCHHCVGDADRDASET